MFDIFDALDRWNPFGKRSRAVANSPARNESKKSLEEALAEKQAAGKKDEKARETPWMLQVNSFSGELAPVEFMEYYGKLPLLPFNYDTFHDYLYVITFPYSPGGQNSGFEPGKKPSRLLGWQRDLIYHGYPANTRFLVHVNDGKGPVGIDSLDALFRWQSEGLIDIVGRHAFINMSGLYIDEGFVEFQ